METDYPPLTLAYLGDAVFELLVRKKVVSENGARLGVLNKISESYVKAGSQAKIYHKILPFLSEREAAVLKRGRNTKGNVTSKSAAVTDYRHATGLEALFGYLYITGQFERLNEIFEICVKAEDE